MKVALICREKTEYRSCRKILFCSKDHHVFCGSNIVVGYVFLRRHGAYLIYILLSSDHRYLIEF